MSVKVNGDSSNRTIAGTVDFGTGNTWNANTYTYTQPGLGQTFSYITVMFDDYWGTKPFRSTPAVVATVNSGSTNAAIQLEARVGSVTTTGFNIYVFNNSSSTNTVSSNVKVAWIATEVMHNGLNR
jgi:hypothetical protein